MAAPAHPKEGRNIRVSCRLVETLLAAQSENFGAPSGQSDIRYCGEPAPGALALTIDAANVDGIDARVHPPTATRGFRPWQRPKPVTPRAATSASPIRSS